MSDNCENSSDEMTDITLDENENYVCSCGCDRFSLGLNGDEDTVALCTQCKAAKVIEDG